MQFNNPYNYTGELPVVEYPPSPAVPDLSMSVAEILRRYTSGEPIPTEIIGQPHYNLGNLSPMSRKGVDLADWSQLMSEAKSTQLAAIEEAQRSKERRDARQAEIEKQRQAADTPPVETPA